MLKRTASTLALWALLVCVIFFGGPTGFSLLMLLLSIPASWEACMLLRKCGLRPSFCAVSVAAVFMFCAVEAASAFGMAPAAAAGLSFSFVAAAAAVSVLADPYSDFPMKRALPTLCVVAFVPFMLLWYAVVAVSFPGLEHAGLVLAVWGVAAAKFSDIGGYLFGMFMGRRSLAPSVSPKKTLEGAAGGIMLSAAVSVAIFAGFRGLLPQEVPFWALAASGVAGGALMGAAAIVSDLLESVLKRRAGVKDSGATIPGIGGALDLADSLLLTGPLAAFLGLFVAPMLLHFDLI